MKNLSLALVVFLLGAICVGLTTPPAVALEYQLTVEAGDCDRAQVPVVVLLAEPIVRGDSRSEQLESARSARLIDPDGNELVGQITPLGLANPVFADNAVMREVHFVLPELAKGTSLSLRLILSHDPGVAGGFVWGDTPGKHVDLLYSDRPVLRYMYEALDDSTPARREQTYKVYHHLFNPAGTREVTKGPGGLYTHHRGIFYGFNRVRYGEPAKNVDTWHCKGDVHLAHDEIVSEQAGRVLGRHTVAINWNGVDKETFAVELRELTVYRVPGGQLVQFVSRLKSAGEAIRLDGDPQHAGFQFRAAQDVAEGDQSLTYYLRPSGKGQPGETRNWGGRDPDPRTVNLPFNAMSFVIDDQRYTAVYVDHPDNPKEARYSERTYGRFGSYFEHDLAPDAELLLKYRVWLQEGEMDIEEAKSHVSAFVTQPEVELGRAPTTSKSTTTSEEAPPKSETTDAPADNTPPEGFTALFNGKDLTGWKGLVGNPKTRPTMEPEKLAEAQAEADKRILEHWKVVDGVIVFDGKGKSLCTAKDYGDFDMYVDWKIKARGDSGIYLRGSPQVQIWDPASRPEGSGGLFNNKNNPSKPTACADNPIGEWNTFRIKMVGEKVSVWLNGQLVVDDVILENYWERDKPIYPTGQIELQNHGNTLYFKNIYVREL